mgnify:CR=1 FL=1
MHKPSKADPRVGWWKVANALAKTPMYAKVASFDDELAWAYGIEWEEDLFGPADEDGHYTTNVERSSARSRSGWRTICRSAASSRRPTAGVNLLPPKAERGVHGKSVKSDCVAIDLPLSFSSTWS